MSNKLKTSLTIAAICLIVLVVLYFMYRDITKSTGKNTENNNTNTDIISTEQPADFEVSNDKSLLTSSENSYSNSRVIEYKDKFGGTLYVGKVTDESDKLYLDINYKGETDKTYGVLLDFESNGALVNYDTNIGDITSGTYLINESTDELFDKTEGTCWRAISISSIDKIANIRLYNYTDNECIGLYSIYVNINNNKYELDNIKSNDINESDDVRFRDTLKSKAETILKDGNAWYMGDCISNIYSDYTQIELVDKIYGLQIHKPNGFEVVYSGKIYDYPLYAVTVNFEFNDIYGDSTNGGQDKYNKYQTLYFKKVITDNGADFEYYGYELM